jgi:hypothetical protein
LDLTIDRLGREKVEANLAFFRKLQQRGHEACLHKTTFPCSEGGVFTKESETDCLWKDSGCGCACLDEVAENFDGEID